MRNGNSHENMRKVRYYELTKEHVEAGDFRPVGVEIEEALLPEDKSFKDLLNADMILDAPYYTAKCIRRFKDRKVYRFWEEHPYVIPYGDDRERFLVELFS